MKKKIVKKITTLSTIALAGIYGFNKYIDINNNPVTPLKENKIYQWKDIKIIYTEKGKTENSPLLLLHNLHPAFSKEEWYMIDNSLAEDFHIFEVDLPGCGNSAKPDQIYINYMYVQFLQDFIKNIIGKETNICSSSFSSSFVLMTARMNPDLINKIIIINPTSIDMLIKPVTKMSELKNKLLGLPIIGTLFYNIKMSKASILDDYKYLYFYNDRNVPAKAVNISYYNAHVQASSGRFLYGSILGNYTNINIIHALPFIKNKIYFIGNGNYKSIMQKYKEYKEDINCIYISNCRLLPQLEIPQTITEKIKYILNNNERV